MAHGEPIAIARGGLEPLPHQLAVLERALATEPLRLLLADAVGLGKTIEAGLIITELKARGLIRRVLVVAPKGVQLQWVTEMSDRFSEDFVLVGAGGVPVDAGINPWRAFDQIVCSIDSVKPIRARTGWSPERIADHNELRERAIVEANWDLVIIDEAHHVAGASDEVARHVLGRRLAQTAPRILLLSATPHSGKSDAFARLLGLLDDSFLRGRALERRHIAPLVIRTDKQAAIDNSGRPLFRARKTMLATVPYDQRLVERDLYDAVTDYVRHGYQRSRAERRPIVGFLVLLMQRLVSSSTAAILAALQRRLLALTTEGEQLRLFSDVGDWDELTGEEQQAALADAAGAAWYGERSEVELLLQLAWKAASAGIDAKARYLIELLGSLAQTEGDAHLKALIFTEFVATQQMLMELLAGAGITAVAVNGSMSIAERREAQDAFARDARILVATDAGGEGVNLQVAHVVVNYDLPWAPTRLEQRIGRVDRIGQTHEVVVYNLVLESSIDARVLTVLQEKLAVILQDLGVDLSGDILATVDIEVDALYAAAILDPTSLEEAAADLDRHARQSVQINESFRDMLGPSVMPARQTTTMSLKRWLDAASAALVRLNGSPNSPPLPEMLPGEPVPTIRGAVAGWWTMWETGMVGERSCFALFLSDRDAVRPDLSERIWIELADGAEVIGVSHLDLATFARLGRVAADHGYRIPNGAVPTLTFRLAARVDQ